MARTKRSRGALSWLASLVALAVLWAVVGAPFFVFPKTDTESKTDVVMVVGPPESSRIAIAEDMIHRGLASELVVSVPSTGKLSRSELTVCAEKQTFAVTCFTPDPFTTQGEARELKKLSVENHWTSATVVTATPHIFRARMIMQRCFAGDLDMIADRTPISPAFWAYSYVYQTFAMVKAAVNQGC